MSNPLAAFRKHQKVLLAVFGVALMIVFSIGTILTDFMGSSQSNASNDVVVKLATGDLHERDLLGLQRDRLLVRQYMTVVRMTAAQKGATPQQTLGIPDTDDESNLVQTAVLADQARELGIVVSDDAIINFLMSYTEGTLERGDFARILNEVGGRNVSQRELMNALRRELMAMRFVGLFQRGVLPPTPTAAWDYHKRLRLQASFEAVPFEAEDYLAKVADPSDAEIRRVYEEGKDDYPLPDRPQPGFKRLKKVAVEYVKAELQDFLPAARAAVTDEQVAAYYEANKTSFRNIDLPDGNSFAPPTSPAETPEDATPEDSTDESPAADSAESAPENQSAPENTPSSEEQPASDEPASDGADTSGETDNSDAAEASEPQPLQDDPTDSGPKQNSAPEDAAGENPPANGAEPATDTDAASQEAAAQEQAVADEPVAEESATEGTDSAADETTVDSESTNADVTETESETTEPESTESEPAEAATGDATESEDAENAEASESGSEDTIDFDFGDFQGPNARPEFMPLSEVADEIRTSLARPIARRQMDDAVNTVRSAMRTYYGSYIAWEIAQEQGDEQKEPPQTPDLRTLAGQNGLEYGQTPLVDVLQLQETDLVTGEPLYEISRAYDASFVSFAQKAFSESLGKFEIQTISGQEVDTEYIFWKTDDRDDYVPELEEARAEVVRAIKLKEAIKLARQAAEEAAEELRKSNQRPSDAFRNDPNRKVIEAKSITWMTSAGLPYMPPQVNRLPGIRYPGDNFMRAAFSLEPGAYGVGLDQPEDTAYLIAMTSLDSQVDQLRQEFFRQGPSMETLLLAQRESQQHLQDWYQKLEDRLGIRWERDPRPDSSRQ